MYFMLFYLYFSIIFMSINLLVQHLEADLEPALNNMTKVNNMSCSNFIDPTVLYIIICYYYTSYQNIFFRFLGKILHQSVIKVNMLLLWLLIWELSFLLFELIYQRPENILLSFVSLSPSKLIISMFILVIEFKLRTK